MEEFKIEISAKQYSSLNELADNDQTLIKQALEAAQNAYAPYSEFQVGAAVLLQNGETICGNNQENAAYPSGLCAERVAMFYANAKYPESDITTLAITAIQNGEQVKIPISPCGACRQSLLESEMRFKTDIRVLMVGKNRIIEFNSISDLLPLNFSSFNLHNVGK